ncbi:hypothetical protein JTE90_016111 [Oedothorax gibbosus]|uniref:Myeloid differentiation primary response protein MyD88 n=1 Tax=Oedothorax gibbosus TaxID=931172 RepID=A0AAV6U2V4_9ARAC|nr:hypothetical protein JTE90_016111 [Oedothorax gibbosus]
MDDIDFNSISATALNYSSRHLLGQFLNPKQNLLSKEGYSRDYHGLAEQMNFQYNVVRNFERSEDVTMKILEAWSTEPDATIGKLISFLENMGRHDVIEDMQSFFEKDAKVYLNRSKPKADGPVQVPEVTSCRSQLLNADDLNILTREDAYTGESTSYDAYVSYADEDIDFVYNLARYLEDSGFKLFIRSRDLLGGHTEYETNMQLIKSRCKRVLIVLSPSFLNCPACEVQAGFAASLGFEERCRKIIPILWQPCEIPLILKFISRIDFTKPGIQEWIWDQLKSSLRDTCSSTFISPKRIQGPTGFPQIEPPESSNPTITFPSTGSYSRNSLTVSGPVISSAAIEEIANETASSATASTKPKNKLSNLRFWQRQRVPKKDDSAPVSSSSNATSGFHSQSGNVLESNDTVASSEDTSV